MPELLLVPYPRKVQLLQGSYKIPAQIQIVLDGSAVCTPFAAAQLQEAFAALTHSQASIICDSRPLNVPTEIRLRMDPSIEHAQGFHLRISTIGVGLAAATAAGMFYAVQTLIQLLRQFPARLPQLAIEDHPDFARRGFYHDISRGKVPKRETLLQLVDDLAALKINEFQLYVENVYAFRRHPAMFNDTQPLTSEDLLAIDAACRDRHINFVPSLTSLGHFDKILKRKEYRHLAEAEPEDLKKQGIRVWSTDPWTLCVTDPGSKQLLTEMYDEFLPNFTSKLFNICCDESWDLGKGRSKELSAKLGPGNLYVDWINFCHGLAKKHGRQIQMWGDIILNHPDLLGGLPDDAILLEWGYEATHKFAEHGKLFQASGKHFYVAPGTATWLSLAGRTENAFGNMKNAAIAGLQCGAQGFLNTDWGDHGHQQMLAISLLPLAFGAAVSWNHEHVVEKDFLKATSLQVFGDRTLKFAGLAADLGNTYTRLDHFEGRRQNSTFEFWLFREPWAVKDSLHRLRPDLGRRTVKYTEKLLTRLQSAKIQRPDAPQVKAEFLHSARVIIHTVKRSLIRQAMEDNPKALTKVQIRRLIGQIKTLAAEFKSAWLARNHPSRMEDVLAHFHRLQAEYQALLK